MVSSVEDCPTAVIPSIVDLLEESLERHSEATAAFKEADRLERCILESVLSDVPIFELLVPRVRNPSAVVAEISRVCGLGGVS